MNLYAIKPWFVRRLRGVEDYLVRRSVTPTGLTRAAVVVSVAVGLVIALGGMLRMPSLWLAVPPLVLVRLALNALDGSVARRTGRARPWGTAENEIGDRLSDAVAVGGTAFVIEPGLAMGAVAAGFLASSCGVLSLALTGARDCGGPFGKADRAAMLAAGAATAAFVGSTTPFTVVVVAILLGGVATAGARLVRLRAALAARPAFPQPVFIDMPEPAAIEDGMIDALAR
jgi:CDP-diacylglycerol--glycerol-3-phosphate 3-phosphatidyltransferase